MLGTVMEHSMQAIVLQKGWLAIAKLKPLVEREFLSTNEKAWFPNSKQ